MSFVINGMCILFVRSVCNVKQVLGKNSVQIARGKDEFHYHEIIGRTNSFMSEEDKSLRIRENKYLQEIFYKGSDKKGTY